jgi:hypothetical protein
MPSPNLAIAHVAASQNQKEVTINDAIDALDLAMTAAIEVDCSASGTIVVTAADLRRNLALVLTGSPATGFVLQLPAVRRLLYVQNTTGQEATVTGPAGGTTVPVPAGSHLLLYATGTAVLPVEAALGATGVTPGSYGDGANVPRLTVNAQGRITHATTLPVTGGGGGGGSGGAWFSGATGNAGAASSSAFATKGLLLVPERQLLVTHACAYLAAAAVGQDHFAQIAELTGPTASDSVTAVLATSATRQSVATHLGHYRFAFAEAVLLDPGKVYLIAAVNADGSGTTASRLGITSSGTSTAWDPDAPAEALWGAPQFASIGLTIGQSPDAFGTGKYNITLEGSLP